MAVIYYNATDLKKFGEHIAEWVQKGMLVPDVDGKIKVTSADIENWKVGRPPLMSIWNIENGIRISLFRLEEVIEFVDSLRKKCVFQTSDLSLLGHYDDDCWFWDHGSIEGVHVPEKWKPDPMSN